MCGGGAGERGGAGEHIQVQAVFNPIGLLLLLSISQLLYSGTHKVNQEYVAVLDPMFSAVNAYKPQPGIHLPQPQL